MPTLCKGRKGWATLTVTTLHSLPAFRLTLPTAFFRLKDSDNLQVSNYG